MIWHFENTGENTGRYNMEYDIELSEAVNFTGIPTLRVFRWKPYAISLGYNQSDEIILKEKCEEDNIDIVRRPTGGRAILHSEELTYSVAMKLKGKTSSEVYNEISKALVYGLQIYDEKLKSIEFEKNQMDFLTFYKSHSSVPCFSSSSRYEIKFGEKKLVGSAQRNFGGVLLQHGSILCGTFHKKLIDYLNLPSYQLKDIEKDFELKTISISEIIDDNVDYDKLAECLKFGFQKQFAMSFSHEVEHFEI